MIFIGFIVGFLYFGSNSWAITNRIMGLPIALSYLIVGGASVFILGRDKGFLIMFILCTTYCMTIVEQFLLVNILGTELHNMFEWDQKLSGFLSVSYTHLTLPTIA